MPNYTRLFKYVPATYEAANASLDAYEWQHGTRGGTAGKHLLLTQQPKGFMLESRPIHLRGAHDDVEHPFVTYWEDGRITFDSLNRRTEYVRQMHNTVLHPNGWHLHSEANHWALIHHETQVVKEFKDGITIKGDEIRDNADAWKPKRYEFE